MRCSYCSSGRVKRAENFGADRMQCGMCGIVTKQAHHPLTGKQQELVNYLSNWNSGRWESSREGPEALTQNGIADALGIHRSNVNRIVQPLIDQDLVRQKKCHITNEEGRVISRMVKTIYYLTREGWNKRVTPTSQISTPPRFVYAETFESEIKWDGVERFGPTGIGDGGIRTWPLENMKMIWLHYTTDFNGDTMPHLTFDTYQFGLDRDVFYRGGRHYGLSNPDGNNMDDINELIQAHNDWVDETGGFVFLNDRMRDELGTDTLPLEKLPYPWNGDYVRYSYGRTEGWRNARENFYEAETFASETFRASKSDLRRRRRTPFYKIERTDEDEDHDQNKYARTNAGGALWEATYQALRDDGMSHEQAETFCNGKFFDHYYEYLIEGLRTPMRNLINRLQKPSLGLTRKQRKSNREARQRIGRYFPDMASENFHAHEGGHFEDIHYESDTYPLRPTRPSGPWPTPTPRPRRPNRRPNPRPRPARRPF